MKDKILLLGELKEHTLCAEEFLLTKYRVQRCSMVQENVEGMIKIMSPDIVVACQLGEDSNNQNIFKWLREQHPEIPILFICSDAVRVPWVHFAFDDDFVLSVADET